MSDGPEGELTAPRGEVTPLRKGEGVGVSDEPEGELTAPRGREGEGGTGVPVQAVFF